MASETSFRNIEKILRGLRRNRIEKLREYDYIRKAEGLAQKGINFMRAAGNGSHNPQVMVQYVFACCTVKDLSRLPNATVMATGSKFSNTRTDF